MTALQIAAAQHSTGGWGWRPNSEPNTECTSLALLATRLDSSRAGRAAYARGRAWLLGCQNLDGGWPVSQQVPGSSWMTSLAVIALSADGEAQPHALRGASWLLGSRSRGEGLLVRGLRRVFRMDAAVDHDLNLLGWPWAADTTAWVEPTSWALLALKRVRSTWAYAAADMRIRQGDSMLVDRMCVGGGWNYGNRRVLGEALEPFPDTTALALMALQDVPSEATTGVSIRRLETLLDGQQSTLTLSLAVLCAEVNGNEPSQLRERLTRRLVARPPHDLRSHALALLALHAPTNPFKVYVRA
jgi:hypothetical protein